MVIINMKKLAENWWWISCEFRELSASNVWWVVRGQVSHLVIWVHFLAFKSWPPSFPVVVLDTRYFWMIPVWLGSCKVRLRPWCSGLNKHVNFGVYLFLKGVHEVTELSNRSTASDLPGADPNNPLPNYNNVGSAKLTWQGVTYMACNCSHMS